MTMENKESTGYWPPALFFCFYDILFMPAEKINEVDTGHKQALFFSFFETCSASISESRLDFSSPLVNLPGIYISPGWADHGLGFLRSR